MSESRDEVDTSNNLIWIEKGERIFGVIEPDSWISPVSKSRPEAGVATKPAHIKEGDVLYIGGVWSWLNMTNTNMKDADDPTIPVRMWIGAIHLMRPSHEVSMVSGIQGVLTSATVICGVIDT